MDIRVHHSAPASSVTFPDIESRELPTALSSFSFNQHLIHILIHMDTIALSLFQSIKEGMQTGRIADIDTALTEVEVAILQLNHPRLLDRPTRFNDIVTELSLEIGTLRDQLATCESRLAECQSRAEALKEETSEIAARTEACNLLVEQQHEENLRGFAATEGTNASVSTALSPCLVPTADPDPVPHPARPRIAVISFPGGPRTVTIHPPNSPSYQSVIRDEKGDVIIALETKPLRREGAFRGSLEDIDWRGIYRVYGRGPEPPGPRAVPPVPCWPDRSQPSASLPPRGPNDIVARQHQLSTAMHTDAFGRVLATDHLFNAMSPSLPTDMSSSDPAQDSTAKHDTATTPVSSPPSPSAGRGKKRTRPSDEDEGAPPMEPQTGTLTIPPTPTPTKRGEAQPPQGPTERKKRRTSAALSAGSAACPQRALDVARAD